MSDKKQPTDSVVRSAIINVSIKPIGMVLSMIYTPLLLAYLGKEQYGVWVTLLSVISWINYCDIGIGNGLRNILTKELTNKQYENAKKAISTAYICLSVIMGVLLGILVVATFFVDWSKVLGTTLKVDIPLLISFAFICVNFVFALCNNVLYSIQESELVSIQSVVIQVVNIVGILILRATTKGSLIYISLLFGSSTFIIRLLTSIMLYRNHKELGPSIREYEPLYTKKITSLGIKFFVAQIAALILFTTDNLMVSYMFGAIEVTPFSLADKVFNTGFMFFSALMVPFWSKTTQEIEKKNYDKVKRYFCNLNKLCIIFAVGCILVAIFFKPLVTLWLRQNLLFSKELIYVMCVYYIIYSFCGVSSPFINGMGGVNGAMLLGVLQGILNIPLSFYFAKVVGMGIVGIRMGTLVVVLFGAVFQFAYFYYLIRKIEQGDQEC